MTDIYKKFSLLLCATLGVNCSSDKEVRVNYDEIGGASAVSDGIRSACELAVGAEQAGQYRVVSMTGVYEEFPRNSDNWEPRTYVELEVLDKWSENATDVTLRVHGGPFPDGGTAVHFLTLRVGETVGAIIEEPQAWNADYRIVDTEKVFRETEGEMSNEHLRATTAQLAAIVGRAIDDGDCPVDIDYERRPSEPPDNHDHLADDVDAGTAPDAG